MPRDKLGNKLTWKEYIERWKAGIRGITPLQSLKHQLRGQKIILLGILLGIVMCVLGINQLWWLLIILVGAFYVNIMQYIGMWQRKKVLEQFEIKTEKPFDKGLKITGMDNKDSPFEKHFMVEDDIIAQNDLEGGDVKNE